MLQNDAACWWCREGGSTAPVPRRREPRGVADSAREGSKGDADGDDDDDDDDDDDGVEEVVVVEEEEEAMRNDMMSDMPC